VDAVDLADYVDGGPLPGPQRRRLARAVADAVARMHDAGILHADLNLRNLLVRETAGAPEVFVIDFDRARVHPELSLDERLGNLFRLDRSAQKWPATRRAVGLLDRLRVLRAYLRRYPQWRGREREVARAYRGVPLRHRLFRPSLL
jgi:tRNA A-37 threonylcarbamoyl transferase component Bud32